MGATVTYRRTNFYFVMFLVNIMSLALGNTYSWTAPTIPILMSPNSPLPIDLTTSSFIASLYLVGGAISPFFASPVTQMFGFKLTFIFFMVLILASWICLACTWTVYALYVGRFLSGCVASMMYMTLPLYIAEISEDSLRGAMSSLLLVVRCVGILMEFAIGPYVTYHTLIIVNSISPIIYLLCSPWMPESPHYLVTKGKREDAVKTVAFLRGGIPTASAEVITNQVEMFIERTKSQKKTFKDLVATHGNIRALFITMTLLALQQLTGVTAIGSYTQQVFEMASPGMSASISAIIYGVVYVIGSGFGPTVAKRYGFRMPLIISGIILFFSEFLLGVYLYCFDHGVDVSQYSYFPVICVLVFASTFNIAAGPTPWAIMGESFPANIKGKAASLSTSSAFTCAFLATQTFPILTQLIGLYSVFWIFSFSSILISVFTAIFVLDTRGLSLDQIQDKLNKTKHSQENQKSTDEPISVIA